MSPEEILFETEASMEKAVDYMTHEFSGVRTGKASPALVENIDVEAYGASMKLKQVAVISVPEPRMLLIQPFDAATTKDIERAIKESKLGINPITDGKVIRLPMPELSEERRRDLVKTIKQMSEEARVRVRGHRRDGIDEAKKGHKAGEYFRGRRARPGKAGPAIDRPIRKRIDDSVAAKEADIMKV